MTTDNARFALLLAMFGCSSPAAVAPQPASPPATVFEPAELMSRFDVSQGELPEGLVTAGDSAFVGMAPSGKVVRLNLTTGELTPWAQLPAPVPNQGFLTGLAVDAKGDLYAGLTSFNPDVQPGIYRVAAKDRAVQLFAKDAHMTFPNGLAYDAEGELFVTDSGSGSVFRIGAGGEVERWASGEELTGAQGWCGEGTSAGFDIGANGVVVDDAAVYVVNNDRATLLRIARRPDGSAAPSEVLAGPDCDTLGGADGLTRDANGDFLIALNRQNKIVRITMQGKTSPVAADGVLDFPASFAWSGSTLYATNFALATASSGGKASPGIVRLSAALRLASADSGQLCTESGGSRFYREDGSTGCVPPANPYDPRAFVCATSGSWRKDCCLRATNARPSSSSAANALCARQRSVRFEVTWAP